MFDFSFLELLVVGAVALVVIGPERLPQVARTVGKWVGKVQRYVADVKRDINREMEFEELRKLRAEMNETARSVEATARSVESSLRQQQMPDLSATPKAEKSAVTTDSESAVLSDQASPAPEANEANHTDSESKPAVAEPGSTAAAPEPVTPEPVPRSEEQKSAEMATNKAAPSSNESESASVAVASSAPAKATPQP